jgi:alkylation response protein AidB-like acyl-CoA dehydrogenase
MNYQPHPDDIGFILFDVLDAPAQLQDLSNFAECDADLMKQVLEEAAKFAGEVVAPLNRDGDEIGCAFSAGRVTTPPGFRDAYQSFWQAGWPALAVAPEDGGQGLPWVLEGVLYEWLSAANHGWTMAPGLLHGAYECIKHYASADLKSRYLTKVGSGEWLATMCLTEPHAGSDLGLVRTKAVPQPNSSPEGSFALNGTKIFISGGEHDLSSNIVHLVLARLPDAPPGPKGLSLFLAPKLMSDGSCNTIYCERIEEKMGLHGSPTCVMRFDDATGWLIGEPGRGLHAMFMMMNAARLHVALQGIGLLDAAWQKAHAYAKERRQMRAPVRAHPGETADLINEHPAVQRILNSQRAWVLGGRVLAYQTGIELDIARAHPDATRRKAAERWCSLLTPVLKAACTDQAFHGASDCLQVFGGHGYVREWGVEQIVRDSRVAMIYEGTNEIQAIDLLVRKVLADQGAGMNAMLTDLQNALTRDLPEQARVSTCLNQLTRVTAQLVQAAPSSAELPYSIAGDYLRAVTLAMMSWAWARIDGCTIGKSDIRTAGRAFERWVLPEFDLRLNIITAEIAAVARPEAVRG